jgi:hypothetical protein
MPGLGFKVSGQFAIDGFLGPAGKAMKNNEKSEEEFH